EAHLAAQLGAELGVPKVGKEQLVERGRANPRGKAAFELRAAPRDQIDERPRRRHLGAEVLVVIHGEARREKQALVQQAQPLLQIVGKIIAALVKSRRAKIRVRADVCGLLLELEAEGGDTQVTP